MLHCVARPKTKLPTEKAFKSDAFCSSQSIGRCLTVCEKKQFLANVNTFTPWGELNIRGVAKYSDFGPIERYILETMQDKS